MENNQRYNSITPTDSSFALKFTAMAIGNAMEYFDFAIFGAFADIIGDQYFPQNEGSGIQLLKSLSVFGAAFLMRPFGGILIGYIGDTIGRKRALEISIMLMVFPSFLIGCLPTFEMWGYTATVLLVVLRLLQGLAVGGELVGAFVYTMEATGGVRRGFWCACCKASGLFGTSFGMTLASFLRLILTSKQLHSWGWRLPFLLGMVFGLTGVWLRSKLGGEEDSIPRGAINDETNESEKYKGNPLANVVTNSCGKLLFLGLVAAFWGVSYYTGFVWMSYFMSKRNLVGNGVTSIDGNTDATVPYAWWIIIFMNISLVFLFPVFGLLGDYLGKVLHNEQRGFVVVMSAGLITGILLAIPAFLAICTATFPGACFGAFCFVLIVSIFGSNLPAFMTGLFRPEQRYIGVGIAYNFSQAIFSGTAPFIQTALVMTHVNSKYSSATTNRWLQPLLRNESRIYPAYYVIAVASVSLTVLLVFSHAEELGFRPLQTNDPLSESETKKIDKQNSNNTTEDSPLMPGNDA